MKRLAQIGANLLHMQGVSKNVHVRLLGTGSKKEIALVNLVPRSRTGTYSIFE
jgi:hypothetical protein